MKKFVIALIILFTASTFLGSYTHVALANPADDVCVGIGQASPDGSGKCGEPSGGGSVQNAISVVVNVLSWVVGIAAVIVIIVGGFRYITSGGDSTKVGSAKNTILYAVIGLVIVAMAQVIVHFTLNRASVTSTTPSSPTAGSCHPLPGTGTC